MIAMLPMINSSTKFAFRVHRLVILPDYQGLGIGSKLLDAMADYYISNGNKFYIKTTHLKLDNYFSNHNKWVATSKNKKTRFDSGECAHPERVCCSYEYKGNEYVNKEHLTICVDYTEDINIKIMEEDIKWLRENYYLTIVTGKHKIINPIEDMSKKLGIRTQLLYYLGEVSGTYNKYNVITKWDKNFSEEVRNYYK